jgi:hypothetical protein
MMHNDPSPESHEPRGAALPARDPRYVRPAWYELYWLRAELGLKKPMTAKSYLLLGTIVLSLMVVFAYFGGSCHAAAGP